MWTDPIIEEVRNAREEYAARFGYDLDAIFHDLLERQEEARNAGWKVVSLAPGDSQRPSDSAA
ncbi:MAG TPA: hypothetical protein VF615_08325 [Longimicrobiaceae bacterium]|jgi:hypothetical protein